MKNLTFWKPVIVGAAATPIFLLVTIGAAGAGHGSYLPMLIFYPLSLLLLMFGITTDGIEDAFLKMILGNGITALAVAVAIIQFPLVWFHYQLFEKQERAELVYSFGNSCLDTHRNLSSGVTFCFYFDDILKFENVKVKTTLIHNAPPNNSMDVRAKQRLCLGVVFLPLTCVVAVSPHVISAVSRFLNKNSNGGLFEIKSQDAPRFFQSCAKINSLLKMTTRLTNQWT